MASPNMPFQAVPAANQRCASCGAQISDGLPTSSGICLRCLDKALADAMAFDAPSAPRTPVIEPLR